MEQEEIPGAPRFFGKGPGKKIGGKILEVLDLGLRLKSIPGKLLGFFQVPEGAPGELEKDLE